MTVATQAQASAAAGSTRRPRTNAEAARYSVLRRLAPALKHDMVVNLQAVAMMAEVLNAKLDRGAPDPAEFEANISKMNRLAREAVMTCLKVAAWIEPAEDETIRLVDGVQECVDLLRSSFNFRGHSLANEVAASEFEVSRVALRNLLAASLISLGDSATGPSDFTTSAEVSPGFAVLTVRGVVRPEEEAALEDILPATTSYRALDWNDVQALALAEGVELFRTQDQIVMRIPRMVATSPLGIAPV
jgi:hypothetical protein